MNERRWSRALTRALLVAALGLAGASVRAVAEEPGSPGGVVNVNTATAEQLELLPGIGPARARAILEARRARGGFKSLEELEEVDGIGPAALERLRPHVTLTGKTTVGAQ
jgi:competence protein ComEA